MLDYFFTMSLTLNALRKGKVFFMVKTGKMNCYILYLRPALCPLSSNTSCCPFGRGQHIMTLKLQNRIFPFRSSK